MYKFLFLIFFLVSSYQGQSNILPNRVRISLDTSMITAQNNVLFFMGKPDPEQMRKIDRVVFPTGGYIKSFDIISDPHTGEERLAIQMKYSDYSKILLYQRNFSKNNSWNWTVVAGFDVSDTEFSGSIVGITKHDQFERIYMVDKGELFYLTKGHRFELAYKAPVMPLSRKTQQVRVIAHNELLIKESDHFFRMVLELQSGIWQRQTNLLGVEAPHWIGGVTHVSEELFVQTYLLSNVNKALTHHSFIFDSKGSVKRAVKTTESIEMQYKLSWNESYFRVVPNFTTTEEIKPKHVIRRLHGEKIIFIKTYAGHWPWALERLESVARYAHGFSRVVIVTDHTHAYNDADLDHFRSVRPDIQVEIHQVEMDFGDRKTPGFEKAPYNHQQFVKIFWPWFIHNPDHVDAALIADSDNIFFAPFQPDDWMNDKGQISWPREKADDCTTDEYIQYYREVTQDFLGSDPIYTYMVVHGFMITKKASAALDSYLKGHHLVSGNPNPSKAYFMRQPSRKHGVHTEYNYVGSLLARESTQDEATLDYAFSTSTEVLTEYENRYNGGTPFDAAIVPNFSKSKIYKALYTWDGADKKKAEIKMLQDATWPWAAFETNP